MVPPKAVSWLGARDSLGRSAERGLARHEKMVVASTTSRLPARILSQDVRVRRRADLLEALPAVERVPRPEALHCAGRHARASPERRANARLERDRAGPTDLLGEPPGEAN